MSSVRTAWSIRSKSIAIRSNGSSNRSENNCHPFERLDLSVQIILSSVRTAWAICSENDYCHPFERLDLSIQKILPSIRMIRYICSKNIQWPFPGYFCLQGKHNYPITKWPGTHAMQKNFVSKYDFKAAYFTFIVWELKVEWQSLFRTILK